MDKQTKNIVIITKREDYVKTLHVILRTVVKFPNINVKRIFVVESTISKKTKIEKENMISKIPLFNKCFLIFVESFMNFGISIRNILNPSKLSNKVSFLDGSFNSNNNINISTISSYLKSNDIDILVSFRAPIIPEKLLNICNICDINIHCGLLPYHGGGNTELSYFRREIYDTNIPYYHTYHVMTKGVDEGHILMKYKATSNKPKNILDCILSNIKSSEKYFELISILDKDFILKKYIEKDHENEIKMFTRLSTYKKIDEIMRDHPYIFIPRISQMVYIIKSFFI